MTNGFILKQEPGFSRKEKILDICHMVLWTKLKYMKISKSHEISLVTTKMVDEVLN